MRRTFLWMLMAAAGAGPLTAQVTCRPNALGQTTCVGLPPTGLPPLRPYPGPGRGIAPAVAVPAPGETGPVLVPSRRTDVLGNTFLQPDELPPSRSPRPLRPPPRCRPDALGNLICD